MNVLKKEQIKDRLVKLAAERWNVQESEVDANFDPLIMLLFDALAAELEGVGYLIKDIQGNLLQELAGLMLPQSLLNAKPASCIITAMPNEESCEISKYNNFITTTQTQHPGEPVKETDINFTPIGTFRLFNVQLAYSRIGARIYKYNPDGRKVLLQEDQEQELVQEISFVIQNTAGLQSLQGLQLFFDLKGHSEANNFYYTLQQAILTINDQPATFAKGYYKPEQFDISLKDAMNRGGDYSRKIQKEIAGIYARQFITITLDTIVPLAAQQGSFLQAIPANIAQEINTVNPVFFTLKFSRPFAAEMLERMQLGINAIPVINRTLDQVSFKTDRWINIVPLQIKGSYLDVEHIESTEGGKYRLHENTGERDLKEGEAIVRQTRVGKSSSEEIRNTILGLLEAIRDESAYFSRISNDFIATRLTDISKILTRLEDQLELSKNEKSSFRYVLLKPHKQNETVQVSYWSTTPKEAASVKPGQPLRAAKHTFTNSNFTFTLTPAVGGIATRSDYAQKQMLVRQLSSRGKLISAEDIKLLCYELFGNKLKQVTVNKTMKVLPGKDTGISRVICIDIITGQQFTVEELTHIERQLRYQLDTNGSFVFPFEISIKEG